jgi:hypothetical protein
MVSPLYINPFYTILQMYVEWHNNANHRINVQRQFMEPVEILTQQFDCLCFWRWLPHMPLY